MGGFKRADYRLDDKGLWLAALNQAQAEWLGAVFASMDPWLRHGYRASALANYLAKDEAHVRRLGIFAGEVLVGAVGLRLDWMRGPYLQFLGLVPEQQGRGLGQGVLTWLEREARRGGERNLWVAASDFNNGALRLYERNGFVRVALLNDLVSEGRSEILLRKRLI